MKLYSVFASLVAIALAVDSPVDSGSRKVEKGPEIEGLVPLKLLNNMNAEQLFPLTNAGMPAWLLLALLPSWKWTQTLTIIPPLLHAALYAGAIFSLILYPAEGAAAFDVSQFTTLGGIVDLFKDPNGVFAGWVHYLCFDLLVGRGIVQHSQAGNIHIVFHFLFVVPCLFFTLMAGPVGFLGYVLLHKLFVGSPGKPAAGSGSSSGTKKKKSKKNKAN